MKCTLSEEKISIFIRPTRLLKNFVLYVNRAKLSSEEAINFFVMQTTRKLLAQ